MVSIKLTEHARKRAWQRFHWNLSKSKVMFRQSFVLEEIPQGVGEYTRNSTMWVVDRQNDVINVITVRFARDISGVFKDFCAIIDPNTPITINPKQLRRVSNKPKKLKGRVRV